MCVGGLCCVVVSGEAEKKGSYVGWVARCDMLCYLSFSVTIFFSFSSYFSIFYSPLPLLPRPVESDNTLRIKNEKTRSLLLFTNVTEKHFGNYTCFASNRLGASNASMLLFRKWSDFRTSWQSIHMHANPSFCKHTLTFISTQLSISVQECEQMWHTTTKQYICNDTLFSPVRRLSHFFSARCTALFQPSPPSISPFSLFSAPLKLCSPILHLSLSLSLFHSFIHTLTLNLSSIHIPAHSHTHTDYRSVLSRCPRSCHFSLSPIHINRPQWAISYPSASRHPPSPL